MHSTERTFACTSKDTLSFFPVVCVRGALSPGFRPVGTRAMEGSSLRKYDWQDEGDLGEEGRNLAFWFQVFWKAVP